jgi:hypothetical protein
MTGRSYKGKVARPLTKRSLLTFQSWIQEGETGVQVGLSEAFEVEKQLLHGAKGMPKQRRQDNVKSVLVKPQVRRRILKQVVTELMEELHRDGPSQCG